MTTMALWFKIETCTQTLSTTKFGPIFNLNVLLAILAAIWDTLYGAIWTFSESWTGEKGGAKSSVKFISR